MATCITKVIISRQCCFLSDLFIKVCSGLPPRELSLNYKLHVTLVSKGYKLYSHEWCPQNLLPIDAVMRKQTREASRTCGVHTLRNTQQYSSGKSFRNNQNNQKSCKTSIGHNDDPQCQLQHEMELVTARDAEWKNDTVKQETFMNNLVFAIFAIGSLSWKFFASKLTFEINIHVRNRKTRIIISFTLAKFNGREHTLFFSTHYPDFIISTCIQFKKKYDVMLSCVMWATPCVTLQNIVIPHYF